MIQRVTVCGKVKPLGVAVAKASLNRATIVACSRPEASRSTHGQDEGEVTLTGGPNRWKLQIPRMSCG